MRRSDAARGLAARVRPWKTAGRGQGGGGRRRHLRPGQLERREMTEVGWGRRGRRPTSHGACGGIPGGLTGRRRR
jgi:hypothetical protein